MSEVIKARKPRAKKEETENKTFSQKHRIFKLFIILVHFLILMSIIVRHDYFLNDVAIIDNFPMSIKAIFTSEYPPLNNLVGYFGLLVSKQIFKIFGFYFSYFFFICSLSLFVMNFIIKSKKFNRFLIYTLFTTFFLSLNIEFFQSEYLGYNILIGFLVRSMKAFFNPLGAFVIINFTFLSIIGFFIGISRIKAKVINISSKKEEGKKEEEPKKTEKLPEPEKLDLTNEKTEAEPDIPIEDLSNIGINFLTDNGKKRNIEPLIEDNYENVLKTPYSEVEYPLDENAVYVKPVIENFLLKNIAHDKKIDRAALQEEINQTCQILLSKLMEFGIEAKVINVNIGPIITQYELQPAPGIKVNRFVSLSDDLSLAVKAKSIRVQAPIPGRGLIGIEIPNRISDVIYMRDVLLSEEMKESEALLSIALGKDIAGRPIVTDLAKMPHLLIAGATGAGKSVCINTIISSLLFRTTPDDVRLVMIDPKRIELSGYEGIPHLIQNVVTDPEDAMNSLNWAVYEMERRYELLQEFKVRDINGYNQKILEQYNYEEALFHKLPYIIVIVDEFADLIMTAGREIELPITRLAQMARAVGIHLILATQRPSIKVITGVIKANFPARIAFRVSSKVDSRVILDAIGADKLLGRGDMLFLPPGKANPERIHGAFLSDSEIESLVEYLRTQPKPATLIQMTKPENINLAEFDYDDELFPEAAQLVVSSNTASVSMLQRHFKVGYARAGRLIDLLERARVIGPHVGSKSRDVIMSLEDLDACQFKKDN